MKVLIIANADIGLYKFRKELIYELARTNKVFIALPKGEFYKELLSLGCKYIIINLDRHGTNIFREFSLINSYKKLIKRIKPDIVFTYTIKPNIYAGLICSFYKVPYVANITGLGTAVENTGLLQVITIFLYRLGLRRAQKVFFQNEDNMNFMLKNGIVKKSYDILPGSGVNLKDYTVSEKRNKDTIDFAFISRIMKEKGIDQYLSAATIIKRKYPYARFHICGFCEESYEKTLRKMEENKVIEYHGLVKDMASFYKSIDCTIHPSYYPEGLSNVLLETAASGRAIITTNRPGCREVIDDGINGYIVKEKDSNDLIEKIEKYIMLSPEEKNRMGLAGRQKVEKEFDRQIVIKKYLAELDRI